MTIIEKIFLYTFTFNHKMPFIMPWIKSIIYILSIKQREYRLSSAKNEKVIKEIKEY
jgi:hypothetical protein